MSGASRTHSTTRSSIRPLWALVRLLVALLGFVCFAGHAGAAPPAEQSRPRVLLIGKDVNDPLMRRLYAELSELDVTVIMRSGIDRLDTAAREEGAAAAVKVLPARNGVEVWMADATSGRSLLRQVIVDEAPGGPNYNVVALQTAELVRTSLLYRAEEQAERPAKPPQPPADKPPPPAAPAPHSRAGVGIQAGLGLLYSAGGAGAGLQLSVSALQPLSRLLAVELDLSLPLSRGRLEGPEGSALVGAYSGGVALALRWLPEAEPWFASAALGGGVLRISTEGRPKPPLEGSEASTVAGLAYLRGCAGVELTPWLRVGVGVLAGLGLPRARIQFAGNRAGTWGAPLLGVSGLLEVPFG